MTNQLQIFQFESRDVRTIDLDGETRWVGKDAAEILGYSNTNDALARHCKGVVKHYPLQTAGGMQEVRVISLADLLRLIVGSKLPAAERFERWVFEEILPTIHRTGSYSIPGIGMESQSLSIDGIPVSVPGNVPFSVTRSKTGVLTVRVKPATTARSARTQTPVFPQLRDTPEATAAEPTS